MSLEKKKIMFAIGSMSRGGAERVISLLSDYYANKGWDVSLLLLYDKTEGYEFNPKVKVIDKTSTLPKKFRILDIIFQIRKVLIKEKPDVLVSFLASVSMLCWLSGKTYTTKFICSERIDPSREKRSAVMRFLVNKTFSACNTTIMQTKRAFDYFPKEVRDNSVIIPNPVKVSCYADGSAKRFVTAGRLSEQKNHRLLIDAFKQLHEKHKDWTLDIYGEGRLESALKKQIEELGLSEFVFLKGNTANIHEQIADAGCFVLSSDYEGLSNALLEAMMMGLCCISTNCAGSDEAIQNKENGLIVPVGDKQALADAMLWIADNPQKATLMAQKAKESAVRYAFDNVIDLWRQVIEK